jgi:hypothetical protein
MRGRRPGESLFHRVIVPSLWFRQFTHDVKLTNFQNLPPRSENRFKGQTRRLSSWTIPVSIMQIQYAVARYAPKVGFSLLSGHRSC